MSVFKTVTHNVDFCVIGGGLSGMIAAISAARKGIKVALMGDRPVLGGNCSSEIRMWICGGAQRGDNNRETGIIEEITLESLNRNPTKNYTIWDTILYEKVRLEPNIKMILNCSCLDATMDGDKIQDITGWQLTTQTYQKVTAKIFADCSGDSILAPLTGAEFMIGREAKSDFNETIPPDHADKRTMGLSCLIQGKETNGPVEFVLPSWAEKFETCDLQPYRLPKEMVGQCRENFWYLELGGMQDTIGDTEEIRDKLLGIALGMWDYVKRNVPNMENWELDWMGFLPGKRESRRYVGEQVLTENDVLSQGKFDDIVAYGAWSMDDHHPGGFRSEEKPTIFHYAPSPYGIPYRVMYSKNIANLMFAGRNISTTHAALSSTRVMGTCSVIGQAVGTAASIAIRENELPRDVYKNNLDELRQTLMLDDCYLPFTSYKTSELTKKAKIVSNSTDAENLRNGKNRKIGDNDNGCFLDLGSSVQYDFDTEVDISKIRIVFDSDLNREKDRDIDGKLNREVISNYPINRAKAKTPSTITKAYTIKALIDGVYQNIYTQDNNYQRLAVIDCNVKTSSIKFVPTQTWGSEKAHIFCLDVF
ncbi:MAG: FAD-dependent oxidoreductase [Clostridia bacterium]